MKTEGPEITTNYSCFKCKYEVSESYRCQSDSGHDVYCTHPSFPERKKVGDTNWSTPDFCPFRQTASQFREPSPRITITVEQLKESGVIPSTEQSGGTETGKDILLRVARELGATYQVQYVGDHQSQWTMPVSLTPERIERLEDHSIRKIRIEFNP